MFLKSAFESLFAVFLLVRFAVIVNLKVYVGHQFVDETFIKGIIELLNSLNLVLAL